jgi:excinuclease ABC subunit A
MALRGATAAAGIGARRRGPSTMQPPRATVIRGARMHNLQGIDCEIPLGKITVVTGVSGSGKSTLAFDILYAEGQRRFVECLSAYARQFMERLERPEAEHIGYLQPPIAIKQHTGIRNARSTVGSITELSDYLRLLFAHAGAQRCLACGGAVRRTGVAEAAAALRRWREGARLAVVAPLAEAPAPEALRRRLQQGFTRLWRDGAILAIEELLAAGAAAGGRARRDLGLVIDRITVGRTTRARLAESLESAWREGRGVAWVAPLEPGRAAGKAERLVLRGGRACGDCGAPAADPTPALFSWNSPLGACPTCQGFGRVITLDREKVVPDPRRNLRNDAVVPFGVPSARRWYRRLLKAARERGVPTDVPFGQLTAEQRDWVFDGDRDFPGVAGLFRRLERERYKMHVRIFVARFRGYVACPDCGGSRLRREALATTVGGRTIHDLHAMPIRELQQALAALELPRAERARVRPLLESVRSRLECLEAIGVGYLTLARTGRTLSGGETQRIRIAAALGNSLTDTLFVLDEPTVGLHPVDTARMVGVLRRLADAGNTVTVVEHDPGLIEGADHLIVLGPGGGREGGRLVYQGPVAEFLRREPGYFYADELPGAAGAEPARRRGRARRLGNPWDAEAVTRWMARDPGRGRAPAVEAPAARPPGLRILEAAEHNLRIPELRVPLHGLTAITGVSGSGKSTLLDEILYRNWLRSRGRTVEGVGRVRAVEGLERIEEADLIGQEMPGRSSRSNPISFVQAYAEIRKLLAGTLPARQRRLDAGAFSFNTPGGRCETCRGMGVQTLEMYFLPDVEVACEACAGRRFRPEVLEVAWHGKNIDQILDLTVEEAIGFFAAQPRVVARLMPLREVGLGYILLGQSTGTLSGGEAQRLRIATLLAESAGDGRRLFLFDEPTTGLHARDVASLLRALRGLVGRGHAVIAVEHQLDFVRAADWVIDLGPGAGDAGGRVVYAGPAPGLLAHPQSVTARALRTHLARAAAWRSA